MHLPIYQVDAFTNQPFKGNPAAVCILSGDLPDTLKQSIAQEMNLSETAFLIKEEQGFQLRWFTPKVEVNLCGHATLASAHILWEKGYLSPQEKAVFYTKSGILTVTKTQEWLELDFPARRVEETDLPQEALRALNINPLYVGRYASDYLVEVESEDIVRDLNPDLGLLVKAPLRAVMITSRAKEQGIDFVSRFFAPASGIPEDPVTGSAHCALTPYWSQKLSKQSMVARQLSERGGLLKLRLEGDRVFIAGQAVTVAQSLLSIS